MIIDIATSIKYGSYKELKPRTKKLEALLEKYIDKFYEHFDLPEILVVKLRPIRYQYGTATILKEKYKGKRAFKVELDVRQNLAIFKNTILHELTHIEQFASGKIQFTGDLSIWKWNGKRINNSPETFEEYLELPWEKEAIEKATRLKTIIFKSGY